MNKTITKTMIYIVLLVSALGLAACRSQDKNNKLKLIRIGCSSLTPIHCMIGEVFLNTKILENHGFIGEISFFEHGSDQEKYCTAGLIDATFSCSIAEFYQILKCPDLCIAGSPGSLGRVAIVVADKSNLNSIKDLKNKKILVLPGASVNRAINEWFQQEDVKNKISAHFEYSNIERFKDEFENGKYDAAIIWDPWLEQFIQNTGTRILKEEPFWSVILVSRKYLKKDSEEILSEYFKAVEDAFNWASSNREVIEPLVAKRSGIKRSVIANVLGLNENMKFKEDTIRNIGLKNEIISDLKSGNIYLKKTKEIPLDFNIDSCIYNRENAENKLKNK